MSNLRNPNLRTRDIRRVISYKYDQLKWDKGFEENNEWVFTSIESSKNKENLIMWLNSKCIEKYNESLLVSSSCKEPKRITWGKILEKPENYFTENEFTLYDVDLSWVLEYAPQGVSRFGVYRKNKNA